MQPGCTALDQSIEDMNRSVMQLLTDQQVTNARLQLQPQHNEGFRCH